MSILIILYLLLLLISIVGLAFHYLYTGSIHNFFMQLAGGLVLTYLVLLIMTFINPYWDDNGIVKHIEFPDHFGWALFEASFFQLIGVPIFFGIIKLISGFRKKLNPKF